MKKGLIIFLIGVALFTMTGGVLADPQNGGNTPYISMFTDQCQIYFW